jgi:hypothetical protein
MATGTRRGKGVEGLISSSEQSLNIPHRSERLNSTERQKNPMVSVRRVKLPVQATNNLSMFLVVLNV